MARRNTVKRWLLNLLGVVACDNCGILANKGGMSTERGDGTYGYWCERCSNPGFVVQELQDAAASLRKEGHTVTFQD